MTSTHVYGLHGVISQRDSGGVHYYGWDGHSGVRLLMDSSSAVTDSYDYDAFGNLIGRTGSTFNEHMYRGELFDWDLGMEHLRARWRNPANGRFATRDSWEGEQDTPSSLHTYQYAQNDPVLLDDPSGFDADDVIGDALAIKAHGNVISRITPRSFDTGDPAKGASVSVADHTIKIEVPLTFTWRADSSVTPGKRRHFERLMMAAIEHTWRGVFGTYTVTTRVLQDVPTSKEQAPNQIALIPTSPTGPVRTSFVDIDRGAQSFTGEWTVDFARPSTDEWRAAHEAGHLMGLAQQGVNTVGAHSDDIMDEGGTSFGTKVYPEDIAAILCVHGGTSCLLY